MAMMTADELRAVAAIEFPESVTDLPYGLTIEDIGYRRGKTHRAQWINAFWYHRRNVRGYAQVPERRSPLGDDNQTADRPKWINRRPEFRMAQQDAVGLCTEGYFRHDDLNILQSVFGQELFKRSSNVALMRLWPNNLFNYSNVFFARKVKRNGDVWCSAKRRFPELQVHRRGSVVTVTDSGNPDFSLLS
jgi:hypothetical protein